MRTFAALNGLSVFLLQNGEEVGKIIDLLIHEEKVKGLIIDKKGWLNRHLYLPNDHIYSIGQDALTVTNRKKLATYDKKRIPFHTFVHGHSSIRGKVLMSTEGEKLGIVEDVYFQEQLGMIVGYEVTDGLIADLREGKKLVRTKSPLKIGQDVLVIELTC